MRTISLSSFYLLTVLGGTAIGQWPDAPINPQGKVAYQAAYQMGRTQADKELAAGRATIYRYGDGSRSIGLDRKTGLPYRSIADCEVDDQILGRAVGHNERIAESIKEHGLPANSFKRWEKEIFDLRNYYELRVSTEKPQRLIPGGPAVRSPDGRCTIRPVKIRLEKDEGRFEEVLGLAIGVDGLQHEPFWVFRDKGETDFLWGPKGSGFAVIRCRGKAELRYLALDPKRRLWLREEFYEP